MQKYKMFYVQENLCHIFALLKYKWSIRVKTKGISSSFHVKNIIIKSVNHIISEKNTNSS